MKLYYYQPDGHGPASLFTTANTEVDACAFLNSYIEKEYLGSTKTDPLRFEMYPFREGNLKSSEIGEVLENDNN